MTMEKAVPCINNLNDAIKMLINTIPAGCYADLMGSHVWVEQVGNDRFVVSAVPRGHSLTEKGITVWDNFNFDREEGLFNCMAIESWMKCPAFGLLNTLDGYSDYRRKAFVVSDKETPALQKNEEWNKWVQVMYQCVRKNDCTIPDSALELMRALLLHNTESHA